MLVRAEVTFRQLVPQLLSLPCASGSRYHGRRNGSRLVFDRIVRVLSGAIGKLNADATLYSQRSPCLYTASARHWRQRSPSGAWSIFVLILSANEDLSTTG